MAAALTPTAVRRSDAHPCDHRAQSRDIREPVERIVRAGLSACEVREAREARGEA